VYWHQIAYSVLMVPLRIYSLTHSQPQISAVIASQRSKSTLYLGPDLQKNLRKNPKFSMRFS